MISNTPDLFPQSAVYRHQSEIGAENHFTAAKDYCMYHKDKKKIKNKMGIAYRRRVYNAKCAHVVYFPLSQYVCKGEMVAKRPKTTFSVSLSDP